MGREGTRARARRRRRRSKDRAELVGACVAAVAYGSRALTQFRGFRLFGLVGFVGIGSEYAFNVADRVRRLGGDVGEAVTRTAGAVLLCSFTTIVGYGSLLLSDFQALESFGQLAVIGELTCVFAAVGVLPSALRLREICWCAR